MHKIFATCFMLCALLSSPGWAEENDGSAQPSYFELSPSLIANLNKGGKYARVDVQLMTMDGALAEDMQLHAPAIRHELLLLMSDQDGAVLDTPEGKEAFRKQATEACRSVMRELTGRSVIEELFFTAFFVQ